MARKLGDVASMALFDALIEGAVLVRPDSGKIILANKAAAIMLGYISPEAMVGADPLDHIPPEDKGRIAGIMAGYFVEANLQKPTDVRVLALDGRELWVAATGVSVEYRGKETGLILMKDVTAQKAAERSLADAREMQRQILDNANESILVLQDGNVVFANRKALELGSFSEDEIRGKPFLDFLLPEDRERVMRRYLKKAESRDYASTFVVRGLGKNGTVRWSEIREASFMWEGKPAEICLVKDITEQKRAEEALEVSERRYRLLTENVSDVIWVTDLELKPTYFNPSITRMLGYSVEEAMAGAMKMTPASLGAATKAFMDAMHREELRSGSASGAPKMDLEYIHKDGSTVWAETTVSFLRDSKGAPFAVLGILHDVSERRKTEEAIRKSEERFRALIENASDAIIVLSAKGEIVYESPNSQRAVEQKAGGLFSPQLMQIIHPDDVKKILDLFESIKDHPGKSVEAEVRFKHKDGTWHTIEGNARNLLGDPRVNGIVINYRNTTDKKRAQEALKDSEAKYRGLFEGTQTAVQVISMDTGCVVLANEAAARLWGFASARDVVGVSPLDFLQPEDRDWVTQRMAETLGGQRSGETMELRVQASDGRWVWVSALAGPTEYQGRPALLVSLLDITRRREAEDTLRASEEKYRFLVDNTGDYIWTRDLNLRTTYASPSVERILGFAPEERLDQDISEQATPESLERARDTALSYLAMEKDPKADPRRTFKIEMEYYRKDGSTVWLESQVSGIRDSNGELVAFHGVSRDITDRRNAEQALRESETRYRLLADNATDVIWATDASLTMTYVSPSVTGLLGYSVGEITGGSFEKLLAPTSLAHIAEVYAADIKSEESGSGIVEGRIVEVELLRNDGSAVWVETTINTLRNEDGSLAGFQGACRDLTARRAAQESLRASEEKYRLLAENLSDVIWVTSTGLQFTYVSPSVERLTGHSAEEALAMPAQQIVAPDSFEAAMRVMAHEVQLERSGTSDPERSVTLELELLRKDGSTVWTENRISYLRDSSGSVTGFLGVSRDISERRRAEETLRASEERFRTLIEESTDAFAIIDTAGNLLYESPSMERITGYKVDDWKGTPVTDWFLHPDDLAPLAALLERVVSEPNATIENVTARFKHVDGTWHTLEATVRNLVHDPKVGGLLINYRDVTERVRAEEEHRRLREYLQLQIKRMPTGLITWDREFRVQSWNPAAERIFGFTAEEVVGKHPYECIVPAEAQPHVDDIWARLLDGDMTAHSTNENTTKDGRTILCEWTNSPLKEANGAVIGALSMVQDVTESRKAEEALRASEEKFRTIFEQSPIGAIVYDSDGVTVGANKACLEIFGLSDVADMRGPTLFDDPNLSDRARQKLRAGQSVVGEGSLDLDKARAAGLYNSLRSGIVYIRLTVTPLGAGREGSPRVYLALVEDITERKKAQEDLQASEERFRTIFEQSPIGAIVFDAAGVALSANKACIDMFGLSGAADLKGPQLLSDPLLSNGAKQRLRAGKAITAESQINLDEAKRLYSYRYGRSGKVFVRLAVTPLRASKKGERGGYLALVEDITERRKAEEALRASEERFRGLVETASDWVWEVDANGVYTYASPRVKKVLGYDSEEIVGKTPFDFMPKREASRVAAVFNGFAAKREAFAFLENVNRHKNGRPVVMETSGVPFFASDGTLLGYRGVDRDITERKQVGRQLQQSLRRLERTMEAIIQAISTTIETRDPYTAGHQRRVTQLAEVIAKEMGLPNSQVAGIRVAGLLHDIGKICVPTEILNKPGQLSDVEMALIRAHPKVGYGILKGIEFEWPVADIVIQHHERLDGAGYPSGIKGEQILLEARILAVADVVEAMSSHRPYRPAVGMDKAMAEITRGRGKLYDPVVVDACLGVFNKKGFQFEAF